MKYSILTSAIIACALSAPFASAQQATDPTMPAMNMDKQMPKMQENLKSMQQQMEVINKTTDPKERERLMQAHMKAMQENVKAMRGMGGPMMMGEGEQGSMKMADKEDGMAGCKMMKDQKMMGQRMDMMQMMMEQMMQRDQVKGSMPHM